MRFPSGVTDQYLYFVAVDSTDLVTRETGLSTFTVYRARNGAAAAAYTTPTVAEVSSGNMPGVYSLLLDEDMTIGSGNDSEEVVLHITQASMAPVTIKYELYRNIVTSGETLTVASGSGNAAVQSVATGAITAGSIAADAIGASELAADAVAEIQAGLATAAALTTVGNNVVTIAGYLDTEVAAILAAVDTEVAAIKAKTDNLPSDPADASDIATRFTTLDAAVADLPTNAELATALAAADDAVLTAIDALPTNAELATALGTADDAVLAQIALVKAKTDLIPAAPAATGDIPTADITAIKAKTDSLAFTVAGQIDANVQYVNDVQVSGTGASGDEWGPV